MKNYYFVVKQHYGWERRFIKAKSKKDAIYKIVRKDHDFLTDDNHSYKVTKHSVQIIRNKNSTKPAFSPWWYSSDIGDIWFSVYFVNSVKDLDPIFDGQVI